VIDRSLLSFAFFRSWTVLDCGGGKRIFESGCIFSHLLSGYIFDLAAGGMESPFRGPLTALRTPFLPGYQIELDSRSKSTNVCFMV